MKNVNGQYSTVDSVPLLLNVTCRTAVHNHGGEEVIHKLVLPAGVCDSTVKVQTQSTGFENREG